MKSIIDRNEAELLRSGEGLVISPKYFHHEIGHGDHGLVVTVTHKITGQKRLDYPRKGESIPDVQLRLRRELLNGFFKEKDFEFAVGRCCVNGRNGSFFSAVHVPTKRGVSIDSITNPGVKHPNQLLLDMLVEELWREGILQVSEGTVETAD